MTKYIDKDTLVAEIRKRLLPVIRDKHYDINAFNKVIKNEIIKFKFHINPFYNNIYGLIEKKTNNYGSLYEPTDALLRQKELFYKLKELI